MCSLSILKLVSSNRIDRLEVRIVFYEDCFYEISVKSQGVYVSTVILSTVFFSSIITDFLCSELQHYLFLGFFGYYAFVIIHFLLSVYYYS